MAADTTTAKKSDNSAQEAESSQSQPSKRGIMPGEHPEDVDVGIRAKQDPLLRQLRPLASHRLYYRC